MDRIGFLFRGGYCCTVLLRVGTNASSAVLFSMLVELEVLPTYSYRLPLDPIFYPLFSRPVSPTGEFSRQISQKEITLNPNTFSPPELS